MGDMDGESCIGTVVAVQRRRSNPTAVRPVVVALAVTLVLGACASPLADPSTTRPEPTGTDSGIDSGTSSSPETLDAAAVAAPFCAAWTDYAVTIAAVSSATDQQAAVVEIVSAWFLDEAVSAIGANWPTALVGERSAVLTDLVGPFSRRAKKAVLVLTDAGATDDDLAELRLVWRDVAAGLATGEPLPGRLAVPATLMPLVEAAAASFTATVTPFALDPTLGDRRRLLDPLETPLTDAYLGQWCPDVVALGSGLEF